MGINVVKLEDIANIDYGTRVVKSKVEGNEYPVYGGGGETFRINKYNRENCVVISRFAMSPKCTRYVNEKIFLNDSGLTVSTKDNSKLLQEYLDWYILSKNDEIYSLGRGAGQRNLEIPSFKRMFISYPTNLEEQQKIISQLKLADEIRTKKRLANDKLDEFLKSTFISMFGDPVKNDKEFECKLFVDVCLNIFGGGTPSKTHPEYYIGNILWVTPKDMKSLVIKDSIDHINDNAIANSSAKLIPANSILMVIRSGILKHTLPVAINKVDVTVNQDMKAFILNEKLANPLYILYQIRLIEKSILKNVRSVTADNIEFNLIKNLKLVMPSIEEQNKFAQIVEKVEAQKQKNEQVIEQMDNLFNSLSQRAFKGEL